MVETNGVRLHCAVDGDGPLVILLHGFPECWYSWRHQIAALAPRFRVVAPDLRGYNESDKPKGVASYAMDELVADVHGLGETALPPVPAAGSQIVSAGVGSITAHIASITGLGVKYWPAPREDSCAERDSNSS